MNKRVKVLTILCILFLGHHPLFGAAADESLKQADSLRRAGRHGEAERLYTRILAGERDNIQALAGRAISRLRIGNGRGAFEDADRVIALDERNASGGLVSALQVRGDFRTAQREFPEALADYTRAIELDPKEDLSYSKRGVVYLRMERYRESLADLDRAVALKPSNTTALTNRAVVRLQLDDYGGAVADANRAIALGLAHPVVYRTRGEIWQRADLPALAEADYGKALALDARDAETYWLRAALRWGQNRFAEAVADVERYIELTPDDASARELLAGWKRFVENLRRDFGGNVPSPTLLKERYQPLPFRF